MPVHATCTCNQIYIQVYACTCNHILYTSTCNIYTCTCYMYIVHVIISIYKYVQSSTNKHN